MNNTIWQQALLLLPPKAVDDHSVAIGPPDMGLDPLDFVEIILEVERQFGFRFTGAELTELRTVHQSLNGVERHLRRPLYAQFFAQLLQHGPWV